MSASKKGQGTHNIHWVEFNLFNTKTKRFVYTDGDGLDKENTVL